MKIFFLSSSPCMGYNRVHDTRLLDERVRFAFRLVSHTPPWATHHVPHLSLKNKITNTTNMLATATATTTTTTATTTTTPPPQALGFENGMVSLRDTSGQEQVTITRKEPIFTVAWAPAGGSRSSSSHVGGSDSKDKGGDKGGGGLLEQSSRELLAVGCWDQTLSFYDSSGQQHLKDRKLHFYPCSLSYFSDGEYIVIGGSDRRATLCTKDVRARLIF